MSDVTSRPATPGERLRTSETLLQLLIDGVADYAIYLIDPTGHVSSWNSGAQRIKGYLPDAIIGHHFSRFYTEEDQRAGIPERNLTRARETGRVEDEGWRVRQDGTRFWAHVIIDRITDDAGEVIAFAKVTRDVTDQRAAARELEQARESLFQAQKMEALGQLTGGMAHDFNNLLMAVRGGLELLWPRLPDDTRTQTIWANAVAGIDRGASLTQRLLAFARRQELRPAAVDLPALVLGMAEIAQATLGPRITINTRFPMSLSHVEADPHQLELALLNLLVNARDAMPSGGAIEVRAAPETIEQGDSSGLRPGRYVRLSIQDEGQGMAPDTLARATDPFFTTKGVGKGTGLGLSMVLGFAEQSNGRLVLQSEPGRGTMVSLLLPVAASPERPMLVTGADEGDVRPAEEMPAPGRGLRILAVDDDPLVRVTLSALLEDMGHSVVSAESGPQAIDLFGDGSHFDLVVTDFQMPGMTGIDLAHSISVIQPVLPVVLVTGYADIPLASEPGIKVLSKPFDRASLTRAITEAVPSSSAPH